MHNILLLQHTMYIYHCYVLLGAADVNLTSNSPLEGSVCSRMVLLTCFFTDIPFLRWSLNDTIISDSYMLSDGVPTDLSISPILLLECLSKSLEQFKALLQIF